MKYLNRTIILSMICAVLILPRFCFAAEAEELKTSPDQVLFSEIKNKEICDNKICYPSGQYVKYFYHGETVYNNELKGIKEDFKKREADKEFYTDGNKGIIKLYLGNNYDPDQVDYQIVWATTTVENFKNETDKIKISKNFFVKAAAAAEYSLDIGADNFASSLAPNTNSGANAYFGVDSYSVPSETYRSFLSATIPAAPEGETVVSSVELHLYQSTFYGNCNVDLHQLTRSNWTELGSTWNSYNGVSNWTTAGGDYSATVIDKQGITTGNKNVVFTLQGAGADNPLSISWGERLDLLMKISTEAGGGNGALFNSKEAETNKPYFLISYTISSSTPTSTPTLTPWIDEISTVAVRGTIGIDEVDLIIHVPFFLFLLIAIILFAGLAIIFRRKNHVA